MTALRYPRRPGAFGCWLTALVVTGAVLFGLSAQRAIAATIVVDCTANSGALATALASAADGDTLTISGTCTGTFEIAHSLTLQGSGGATLDAQKASTTVVQVDAGKTVAISGLTLTGGFLSGGGTCPGGGIINRGTLTLTNSTGQRQLRGLWNLQ
jgi:methyl coenzyme M reductase beta subunit